MTTPPSAPITLDVVRERFVQAEASLNELTDALKTLRSSSERFDDARGDLRDTSQRLLSLSDQLATTTQGMTGSIELVRQAIGVLEKSDPARVLASLDGVAKAVDGMSVALHTSTGKLTRDVHDLGEGLGKSIGQTRGEIAAGRKWASVTVFGMGALIVLLQLVQLLR